MRMRSFAVSALLCMMSGCGGSEPMPTPGYDPGVNDVPPADFGKKDPGPTFCTSKPADFCADFDRVRTPGAGWSGVAVSGGGNLDLITAPDTHINALRATLPDVEGPRVNAASALVAKDDLELQDKRRVAVSFLAKIGDSKPAAATDVVSFMTVRAGLVSVALFRTVDKWFVSIVRKSGAVPTGNPGGKDSIDIPLAVTPKLETWTRFELEVFLSRESGTVKLRVDGQDAVNEATATIGDAEPTTLTLAVGAAHSSGTITSFRARYDEVTLTLAP